MKPEKQDFLLAMVWAVCPMVSLCGSLEGEDLGFSLAEVLTLILGKAFLSSMGCCFLIYK